MHRYNHFQNDDLSGFPRKSRDNLPAMERCSSAKPCLTALLIAAFSVLALTGSVRANSEIQIGNNTSVGVTNINLNELYVPRVVGFDGSSGTINISGGTISVDWWLAMDQTPSNVNPPGIITIPPPVTVVIPDPVNVTGPIDVNNPLNNGVVTVPPDLFLTPPELVGTSGGLRDKLNPARNIASLDSTATLFKPIKVSLPAAPKKTGKHPAAQGGVVAGPLLPTTLPLHAPILVLPTATLPPVESGLDGAGLVETGLGSGSIEIGPFGNGSLGVSGNGSLVITGPSTYDPGAGPVLQIGPSYWGDHDPGGSLNIGGGTLNLTGGVREFPIGLVNVTDGTITFASGETPRAVIPEPGSIALLACAASALIARRRSRQQGPKA
jgi:hypothetical protein